MPIDDVIITPTTDLFIASLWSAPKNEPILRSLLNGVMTDAGLPAVSKATVLEPFNIQEFPVDKQIRLDVLVEDKAGNRYNVEIQRNKHADFYERMLYYWAETYNSQLKRGNDYDCLFPVRSIIITEFPVFPLVKRLHAIFELRERENSDVVFSDHCQIHVLRLGNLLRAKLSGLDQFGLELRRWMEFWALGLEEEESKMSTMLQDCPPVLAAYEEFMRFSSDPEIREKVRARERFLIDLRLDRGTARREGREEGKIETARNFKRLGAPLEMIAEATGLSIAEIEQLN